MAEILTPDTREAWLAARQSTIGASEAACLFGAHPYLTAYEMWARKTGKITADAEETAAMRRGRLLEEVAVRFLREERPAWEVTANVIPGGVLHRDPELGLSCTPDAFALEPERQGFAIVQIKSVEPSVFRSKWRGEDGALEPPLHVVIQCIQEAFLSGASRAYAAPLVIGHGIDLHLLQVPLHAGLIEALKEKAAAFWAMVASDTPPDPEWNRDATLAAELHTFDDDALDLSGNNALPALLAKRTRRKMYIKAAAEWCAEADGEVRQAIGAATSASLPGWRITARPVVTKPYTVAGRTTRPLHIRRAKEGRS